MRDDEPSILSTLLTETPTGDIVIGLLTALCAAIFLYHQIGYPILLKRFAAARRGGAHPPRPAQVAEDQLPRAAVIVPAHNEAAFIAAKIENLAAMDYPRDRLEIVVALDGCDDGTEEIARAKLAELGDPAWLRLVVNPSNIGKLATLNREIEASDAEFVALSDTSAIVDTDALLRAAAHFQDPEVGVVAGSYRLREAGNAGEAVFRDSQSHVKADEAVLASPIGASGAFYLFRRGFWTPLAEGTINDDFVLPMKIVGRGARGVYDPEIVALELERTAPGQEFWRRVRIGAGNMQQLIRMPELRDPSRGWLAWLFLSGKGLRPIAIFALFFAMLGAAWLTIQGYPLFQAGFAIAAIGSALAVMASLRPNWAISRPFTSLGYMAEGAAASFLGAAQYLATGRAPAWSARARQSIAPEGEIIVWREGPTASGETVLRFANPATPDVAALHAEYAVSGPDGADPSGYIPRSVIISKRVMDIGLSLSGLVVLAILFPFIAAAIKLTSPGPIFYTQMRVGRARRDFTEIFWVYKFRTMYIDAEARGARLASKGDPRITLAGKVLRPTRLDELPQFLNILRGDMSFIGPRPERPAFNRGFEKDVPFFIERTHGLRPGLTGLAQVSQSYDEAATDPAMKVAYDHAYAARLGSWTRWFWTDVTVLFRTFLTVVTRKG